AAADAGAEPDALGGPHEHGELGRDAGGVVGVGVEAGAGAELEAARGEPLVLDEAPRLLRGRALALAVTVADEPLVGRADAEAGEVAGAPAGVELRLRLRVALVEVVGVWQRAVSLAAVAGLGAVARAVERGGEAEPPREAGLDLRVETPVRAPAEVVVADLSALFDAREGAFLILHGEP